MYNNDMMKTTLIKLTFCGVVALTNCFGGKWGNNESNNDSHILSQNQSKYQSVALSYGNIKKSNRVLSLNNHTIKEIVEEYRPLGDVLNDEKDYAFIETSETDIMDVNTHRQGTIVNMGNTVGEHSILIWKDHDNDNDQDSSSSM